MPTTEYIMVTRVASHHPRNVKLRKTPAETCELHELPNEENGMEWDQEYQYLIHNFCHYFQLPICGFCLTSEDRILLEIDEDFNQFLCALYNELCPEGFRYSAESFSIPKQLPSEKLKSERLSPSQEESLKNINQYPFSCAGIGCETICELWAYNQFSKKEINFVWVIKFYRFTEHRETIVQNFVTDLIRNVVEHDAALIIQNACLKYLYRPGSRFVSNNSSRLWAHQ